ncbi:MAG TPA: hypothetical protein VHQ66_14445 [Myxococcota bacterium]|nr:hypothetical protein [Myxococcota bacterium]
MPGPTRRSGTVAARALPWLPLGLLLAVAASHAALVRCCALSPWLGGGFGMFSTIDAREVRALRGGAELRLPRSLADEADRAATLPTDARLHALALALRRQAEHGGAPLRVEAWETRFGPDLAREPRLLRSLEIDASGERR